MVQDLSQPVHTAACLCISCIDHTSQNKRARAGMRQHQRAQHAQPLTRGGAHVVQGAGCQQLERGTPTHAQTQRTHTPGLHSWVGWCCWKMRRHRRRHTAPTYVLLHKQAHHYHAHNVHTFTQQAAQKCEGLRPPQQNSRKPCIGTRARRAAAAVTVAADTAVMLCSTHGESKRAQYRGNDREASYPPAHRQDKWTPPFLPLSIPLTPICVPVHNSNAATHTHTKTERD